ncbi:MAG: hypothetical protein GX963_05015, partial [Bacteroidales bacterium]|nr:hypothetical protein [Bacteroidales bacterium]
MKYYIDWLSELDEKTQGRFENMTLQEKRICKSIMCNIKEELDRLNEEYYPILLQWQNFDIDEYVLGETKPDPGIRRLFKVG